MCSAEHSYFTENLLGGETGRVVKLEHAELVSERRRQVRVDIGLRIQRACSHLTEEEFRDLVELMTDRQLRGEYRAGKVYSR